MYGFIFTKAQGIDIGTNVALYRGVRVLIRDREDLVIHSKGIAKMKNNKLNLTVVHCEKFRNIVGQGRYSPYQVWFSPGSNLGFFGTVMNASEAIASNDDLATSHHIFGASWLQRTLLALRLKCG